jgi:hypothetical protein
LTIVGVVVLLLVLLLWLYSLYRLWMVWAFTLNFDGVREIDSKITDLKNCHRKVFPDGNEILTPVAHHF